MSDLRRQLNQIQADLSCFIPDVEPLSDDELERLIKRALWNPIRCGSVTNYRRLVELLTAAFHANSIPVPDFVAYSQDLAAWIPGDQWADLDYQQHEEFFARLRAMPGYDELTSSETAHV